MPISLKLLALRRGHPESGKRRKLTGICGAGTTASGSEKTNRKADKSRPQRKAVQQTNGTEQRIEEIERTIS